ncbi:hypothetical protein [Methylobacterium sp. SD21]|uniref:hypothetical protein n=1 Tax=Methylobacterium litchii TaxID=3138810 RepID=UPI00313AFFA2
MSKVSDRLGLTLPLHIEFGSDAVQVIDSLGVTAAYIQLADDPEYRQQTGRFSREQAAEIANMIVQTLNDEFL